MLQSRASYDATDDVDEELAAPADALRSSTSDEWSEPPPAAAPRSFAYDEKSDIALGGYVDDSVDFAEEEPTGEREEFGGEAPQETMPEPFAPSAPSRPSAERMKRATSPGTMPPRAMSVTPMATAKRPPSAPASVARQDAPAGGAPGAPLAQPSQELSRSVKARMEPAPEMTVQAQKPVPPLGMKKRRAPVVLWLWLAVILAVIAALLWWLLA